MTSKKCCCKDKILGEWCDHEHYSIDWYNPNNFAYDEGRQAQCKQPNWKTLGTLTTEIPSVGHPMTSYICSTATTDECCQRIPNEDSYLYPDPNNPFQNLSGFRTPSATLNNNSYVWGDAFRYGDILPCWFNGINMTNIENDDDTFFDFTFELKIEKLVDASYQEVINTKINGPGKNLRPHPDAVRSYNVGKVDIDSDLPPHIAFYLTGVCNVFFEAGFDDEGNPNPCVQDFARMPRGPWPYRFKRNLTVNRDDITNCYSPIEPFEVYTVEQVKAAKANPASVIGTPFENMLQCEIVESACSGTENNGCCQKDYLSNKEFCNQLDDSGTPYGWEDCPPVCGGSGYSNYPGSNEFHFFGWLDTANRYTTPEWDVIDYLTNESRKMSVHVLVPTSFTDGTMCEPDWNSQGRSFGEWCFGMDYEAKSGEIDALESAGFTWSDGREQDGIWIHKTPTNALRVLFTLDHADLDQGKVWRVFKDWNVEVNQYVKTFNAGTPSESKFRITLKQKLEEKHLSSLGCDCPSGYKQNDDGSLSRIGPSACDDQVPGFEFDSPNTCSNGNCASPQLHCMNNLGGTKISFAERGPLILNLDIETSGVGCLICDDPDDPTSECSDLAGGSSTTNADTKQNGLKMIVNSGFPVRDLPEETNSIYNNIFADFGGWPSESNNLGCLNGYYFGGAGAFGGAYPQFYCGLPTDPYCNPANIPSSVYDLFSIHSERYGGALADLPFASGSRGSPMGGKRYRNNYSAVQQSQSSVTTETVDRRVDFGFYPHLYGDMQCEWTAQDCDRTNPTNPLDIYIYPQFNVKPEDFPTQAPIGNCIINCQTCILPNDPIPPYCGGGDQGGGGLCPCCDEATYDTDPYNCPDVPSNCPRDQITGKAPRCGTDPPEEFCRCDCSEACVPEGAEPKTISDYVRHPYWDCGANLARINGYGHDDPWWTCTPRWADGFIQPTFLINPEIDHYLGMDSERIYFEIVGQVLARGFLGNKDCWSSYSCLSPGCINNNNSNCTFEYLNEFCQPTLACNFCLGAAQNIGTAFGAMFFNWRKYLCQERTKGNSIPALDAIENIEISCTATKGSCVPGGPPPNPESDPCDHLWIYSDTPNSSPTNFKNYLCNFPQAQDREVSIKLKLSKYDIPQNQERAWLPWSTKYQPNPNRNLLANNRSHIIITARGLD